MAKRQTYAVYAGEQYVMDGTALEVALAMDIAVTTVRKLATPSYQAQKRGLQIVKLGRHEVGTRK